MIDNGRVRSSHHHGCSQTGIEQKSLHQKQNRNKMISPALAAQLSPGRHCIRADRRFPFAAEMGLAEPALASLEQ
jgi:hypothetical protein